jgi:hypothetical protein
MKRLLLPAFLLFFLFACICLAAPANAQDSTKKAEPEVKAPETKAETPAAAPAKAKPLYHYHRIYPAGTVKPNPAAPATATAAPATPVNKDTAAKPQIDPAQLNAKSLNGQYQYLTSKLLNYQQPLVAALWKNVNDTLSHERGQLKDLQAKMAAQTKVADSLKTELAAKEQTASQSGQKSDVISLLGLSLAKSTYNLIMISLVVILAVALAIVVGTTAKHKYEAKHRTELYNEIEEEYKNYKSKANEKELKLARELQTERNKVDELLGRG